jgi:hypothetical protein
VGTDITAHVEVRHDGQWRPVPFDTRPTAEGEGPFAWRSYAVFGFLADVRNYSHSPVIAQPRGSWHLATRRTPA